MYRCRTHENDDWRTAYADFTPPPPQVATSGRMNAAGIIEYVPTQIVTEFFRYVKTSRSNGYAGILYESTQNPGGECLALFLTRDEVLNHKYGIHIIPKATTYHKKEYVTVDNNSTLIAKGKIHIDSLANEKVSGLVKKQKIPKETIESSVRRSEQK